MDEINNQNEKINELIKDNQDKDYKINNLEYKYNIIMDKINELDKFKNKEVNKLSEGSNLNDKAISSDRNKSLYETPNGNIT